MAKTATMQPGVMVPKHMVHDPIIYPGLYAPSGYDIMNILVGKYLTIVARDLTHNPRFESRREPTRLSTLVQSMPRVPSSCAISSSPTARLSTPVMHSTR
jgi:hypothetical protein